jgi:hypothetical protein
VIANVSRPAIDALIEALAIPGEQGPRRFLKSGHIGSQGRHEAVGRLLVT